MKFGRNLLLLTKAPSQTWLLYHWAVQAAWIQSTLPIHLIHPPLHTELLSKVDTTFVQLPALTSSIPPRPPKTPAIPRNTNTQARTTPTTPPRRHFFTKPFYRASLEIFHASLGTFYASSGTFHTSQGPFHASLATFPRCLRTYHPMTPNRRLPVQNLVPLLPLQNWASSPTSSVYGCPWGQAR